MLLVFNNTVKLSTQFGNYIGELRMAGPYYYLSNVYKQGYSDHCYSKVENGQMFTDANINKKETMFKILGYYKGGSFPWYLNREDVFKILDFIDNIPDNFLYFDSFLRLRN